MYSSTRRPLRGLVHLLLLAGLSLAACPALAQYDPQAAFAPFAMGQPVNGYRSSNGLPGPDYWQNRAVYQIHATLDPDPEMPTLSGEEVITYTNNSPDTLANLWLQLDQNAYKPDSRSNFAGSRPPARWRIRPTATCSTRSRSSRAASSSPFRSSFQTRGCG